MLSKRISMKSIAKSSFSGLVNYISDTKNNEYRIESIRCTNFPEVASYQDPREAALAAGELGDFTQDQNKRSKDDKTYHLLVSFRAGERPDPQVLKEIEQVYANALGFGEHQRVSAVHGDTDNLHIHIAFNKIHPTKFTIKTPKNDNWILDQIRESLEEKYGLERDNHIKDKDKTKTQSQSKAADFEAHTGQQSFLSWMEENLKEPLKMARDWREFHQHLEDHGVTLKPRGNGFIFESQDGTKLKASSLGREFSKAALEKKFGAFIEPQDAAEENKAPESPAQAQKQQAPQNPMSNPQPEKNANVGQGRTTPDPQQKGQQTQGTGNSSNGAFASKAASGFGANKSQSKKTYQKKPLPQNLDENTKELLEAFGAEKDKIKAELDKVRADYLLKIDKLKRESGIWRESLNKGLQKEFESLFQENKKQFKAVGLAKESWSEWKERQVSAGNQEVIRALKFKRTNTIYAAYQEERQKIFEERKRIRVEAEERLKSQKARAVRFREELNLKVKTAFKNLAEEYQKKKTKAGDLKQSYKDWLKKEAQAGNVKAEAAILQVERNKKAEALVPLWQKQAAQVKVEKEALLKEQKERIARVRETNKRDREILKNTKKVKGGKKARYAFLREKQEKEIEKIREDTKKKIKKLGSGGLSWADWLKKEAEKGNEIALEALRGRKSSLLKRAERYASDVALQSGQGLADRKDVYVTKNGTLLVKVAGETIRDDGKHLTLSQKSSDEALLFAITAAAKRDGSNLTLAGDKKFQERIVKLAVKEGLNVTFADKKLEQLREKESLNQTKQQEKKENGRGENTGRAIGGNGQSSGSRKRAGLGRSGRASRAGRVVRSLAEHINRYAFAFNFQRSVERTDISKSGFGEPWSASFTAARRNSVRNVPERDMADNQKSENQGNTGSAVPLLVSENRRLGKRPEAEAGDNGVRWQGELASSVAQTAAGSGILKESGEEKTLSPMEKYLAERKEKKGRGIIKETYLPLKEETGAFSYEGIRRMDGQSMVLLKGKEADKFFILPIDKKTENRLRQIKRGQQIEMQKGQKFIMQPEKSKNRNGGR